MITISDRIKILINRDAKGRIAGFSRLTGIPDSTIRSWFNSGFEPKPDKIQLICQACGVTTDWLLYGSEGHTPDLAIDNQPEKGDDSRNTFASDSSVIQAIPGAFKLSGKFRPVPLIPLAEVVRVGFDTMKDREVVMIPQEWSDDPKAYACEIIDDSMEPMYRRGDTVVASPALLPVQGRGAIIKIHPRDVPVVRLWSSQENGLAMLKTCNHSDQDIALRQNEVEWAHKIIIKFEGG